MQGTKFAFLTPALLYVVRVYTVLDKHTHICAVALFTIHDLSSKNYQGLIREKFVRFEINFFRHTFSPLNCICKRKQDKERKQNIAKVSSTLSIKAIQMHKLSLSCIKRNHRMLSFGLKNGYMYINKRCSLSRLASYI